MGLLTSSSDPVKVPVFSTGHQVRGYHRRGFQSVLISEGKFSSGNSAQNGINRSYLGGR